MAFHGNGPVVGSRVTPIQNAAFPVPLAEVSGLPTGFPSVLDSPLAWSGSQLTNDEDYVFRLAESHLKEIDHALEQFKG
jgi:hypothetical protein